jgi:hypothetical protein
MRSSSMPKMISLPSGRVFAFAERQVLRGEHLQLERHREPIVRTARAEPEEAFAGLEHGARGPGLETVEVGEAIGIGLVGPGEPEALDLVLERAVLDQARRFDAGADSMGSEALRGIRGVGIGAHQLSGARPLQLAALEHQAVDAFATGPPGHQPALHLGAVEACAERELPRRQEPCRPGDARDQVQGSETFRGVGPDLPDGRGSLQRLQLALEVGDRPGDLGRAAVLDRPTIIGRARDGAVALRLQRLEAGLQVGDGRQDDSSLWLPLRSRRHSTHSSVGLENFSYSVLAMESSCASKKERVGHDTPLHLHRLHLEQTTGRACR